MSIEFIEWLCCFHKTLELHKGSHHLEKQFQQCGLSMAVLELLIMSHNLPQLMALAQLSWNCRFSSFRFCDILSTTVAMVKNDL